MRITLGAPAISVEGAVATKLAKIIFVLVGLLFAIAAVLPALQGGEVQTSRLSFTVVFLVLALAIRPRRKPTPPPGPGA
jgi:hypothetical protein